MNPKSGVRSLIYQAPVFKVWRQPVTFDDGLQTSYEYVDHQGSVTIAAVTDENRLWFVRQYRHPAGRQLLEFPAGTLEAGELPEQCARRECQEEIGHRPGEIHALGGYYLAPGYSTERTLLFLARDLQPGQLPGDEDERLEAESYSLEEVYELIADGEIEDAKTLAGLLLVLPLLDTAG
ncbi:MAG TPA: NUDIX hydrolase [Anaerolineales bacterium]|jgi:ADP-ribose pyrophosphatase